jgi:hypothetical protein
VVVCKTGTPTADRRSAFGTPPPRSPRPTDETADETAADTKLDRTRHNSTTLPIDPVIFYSYDLLREIKTIKIERFIARLFCLCRTRSLNIKKSNKDKNETKKR